MASAKESREGANALRAFVDGVSYAGNIRPKMADDFFEPGYIPGDERDDDEPDEDINAVIDRLFPGPRDVIGGHLTEPTVDA